MSDDADKRMFVHQMYALGISTSDSREVMEDWGGVSESLTKTLATSMKHLKADAAQAVLQALRPLVPPEAEVEFKDE